MTLTRPVKLVLALVIPTLVVMPLAPPPAASAQETPADTTSDTSRWTKEAELSFVATDGNSETSSLGFGGKFEYQATRSRFEAAFSGVRAESTDTQRTAVFRDPSVVIDETSSSVLTAEHYHAKARLDRDLSPSKFWHVGGSWERDEFSGIDHRFQGVGGVGHKLRDEEDHTWRLDAGVTWTSEQLTVGGSKNFFGVRMLSDGSRQVTESTKFQHSIQVDGNLDETDDYRADAKVSVQVAMSHRLALRTGLQAKFDNQPALESLDVVDTNGDPVAGLTVLRPLEETDLKATVSLVVNF